MSSQRSKPKASIVVTVMILMVVSSFLVLMTMRYVMSMLWWFTALTNYYKAYYLARGWMDVMLTQHSYRWWWYESTITDAGSTTHCPGECGLEGSISSRFAVVDASLDPQRSTQCSVENAIPILPWQSAIFALFSDEYRLPKYFVGLQPLIDYRWFPTLKNIDMYVYGEPTVWNLYRYDSRNWVFWKTTQFTNIGTFSKVPWTPWDLSKTNLLNIVPNTPWVFLVVNNPSVRVNASAKPFRYCFSAPEKNLIGQNTIIRSRAFVRDADVTLETVKTNRFPSILIQ